MCIAEAAMNFSISLLTTDYTITDKLTVLLNDSTSTILALEPLSTELFVLETDEVKRETYYERTAER